MHTKNELHTYDFTFHSAFRYHTFPLALPIATIEHMDEICMYILEMF
jgi:hypothetical protein